MWRNERLGLIMIVASLAVISLIVLLLFQSQRESQLHQIRTQGIALIRILGNMTWDQLATDDDKQDLLRVVRYSQDDSNFAYGVVINTKGEQIREESMPGIIIPESNLSNEPSSKLIERVMNSAQTGNSFLEFNTPIFSAGNLQGYIRLGYFEPGFGLNYKQIPFFATLALPIFLLTPLFYFLMRRETRPMRKVKKTIEKLYEKGSIQKVELHTSSEMGQFMQQLNSFIELTQKRIEDLQQERSRLVTSSKLLSYKQTKIESLLYTLPEAVVVLDESGVVSYANEKLKAQLNVSPDEVIGSKPSKWCTNPIALSYLVRFENNSSNLFLSDCIKFSPDDNPDKSLEMNAYPLFSPKDESLLLGTLIVIRDVTEEQLARRSRGEFVAQVAHELKTPLQVLSMYSESLLGENGESEELRIEAVNVITDEVERLSTLINNLLAITKFELGGLHLNRQRVRPHDLLEDAFSNVSQSGRVKELQFKLDLPKEMNSIYADKALLRIAINNLLTNAIKYNIPSGMVTLTANETDDTFEIIVRDTGIGIEEEDIDKIFDKFYRSNNELVREQTGHGLGLSLAKQIIQLHHGKLSVESTLGKGSNFIIQLDKDTGQLQQDIVA